MRKSIIILFVCVVLLSGCGNKNTEKYEELRETKATQSQQGAETVSSKQLEEDLRNGVSAYHSSMWGYSLDLKEYSIKKSITEDRTLSAVVDVMAESKYACFEYSAEVKYTLYDQGWSMDDCKWEFVSYNVVRLPDSDELIRLKEASGVSEWKELSLEYSEELGSFEYVGQNVVDWSPIACCTEVVTIGWSYYFQFDRWQESFRQSDMSGKGCELKSALEGTWLMYGDETAIISNVSETGFDVELHGIKYDTNMFHVEVDNFYIIDDEDLVQISLRSDVFDFEISDYGEVQGSATISISLYKETQTIEDIKYNTAISFGIFNYTGYGADAYSSVLFHLAK